MNATRLLLCIFSAIMLSSCNSGEDKIITTVPAIQYTAIRAGDTAIASMHISKSTFKGVMEIHYEGDYKDSGDVKGVIKGDTLIGDYHFQHYGLPQWKRDPIAFLRKGDKLIMGQGIIKLTMTIPHYNPAIPINYDERKQFVFIKAK